ncbi:MoaD/ThiS family protein [Christiangramia sp. SM2212]|uniref:Molybdopterin synthase sulfur carrier subunit n=1 Tax=Christiangramia sediminicola TaxID=3073267 RepID=A0ABU1EQ43_9FLAO|nr:MoaD/ThiS family protein [Christiangramia sp. SM2212]MDR5590508.1 MoaD/ThiS family protein [Christiangramia sp. SM2212]
MKLNIKYFGIIAEAAGKTEEVLEVSDEVSLDELKQERVQNYKIQDPDSIQLAVNHELKFNIKLKDGDEIAFLPPFAGG